MDGGRPASATTTSTWGRHHPRPPVPDRQVEHPGPGPGLRRVHGARPAPRPSSTRSRPDVVLAMSPPLTLGPAGWAVARARRVPFVFNIQDVFPDVAVELGVLTDPRVIAAASWLERFSYRGADAVTVLSDDLARQRRAPSSAGRGRDRQGPGDPELRRHRAGSGRARRTTPTGPSTASSGRTVVMYAGNVGLSQSLDLVARRGRRAARRARRRVRGQRRRVGPGRPGAPAPPGSPTCASSTCSPSERLPEVLAAADLHVVPAAAGAGPLERAVEAVLDPRRRPAGAWPASTRAPRWPARSSGPAPGRPCRPTTPRPSPGARPRLLDDPDQAERWAAPGGPSSRAGRRRPRWPRLRGAVRPSWCGARGPVGPGDPAWRPGSR